MRENAFVEAWKTQHRRVSMILGLTLLCAPSAISAYAENGVNDTTVQAVMQTKTVKGTVLDENGEPLIGVSIVVKGTSTGTITDFDGKFSINLPAGSKELVVSYIGYKEQTVAVTGNAPLNLKMVPDTQALDEVVVIGYGAVKKRDLTGAVASVKSEDITMNPGVNPMDALQGKIAGLDITNSSGQAGSSPTVQLRGTRSLQLDDDGNISSSAFKPTYIIDGMPGDIATLNPNDIESIEVLKDASSTAIYGSSGANGVIIVTTKGAKSGKPVINFNAYAGTTLGARVPKMRTGDSYLNYIKDSYKPVGTTNEEEIFGERYDAIKNNQWVNWGDEVLHSGLKQNYSISVAGGTEKTKAYFSLNYTDEKSMYENDNYKVYSTRVRIDQEINKWINAGINVQASFSNKNSRNAVLERALFSTPLGVPYNEDGSITEFPIPGSSSDPNPLADEQDGVYKNNTKAGKAYVDAYLEWKPVKGLSVKSQLGGSYSQSRSGKFMGEGSYNVLKGSTVAYGEATNKTGYNYKWENIVAYHNTFNKDHDLTVTGVTSWNYNQSEEYYVYGENPATNDMLWYALQNADNKKLSSKYLMSKGMGFIGRVNYSYKGKYLFNGSFRRDGSSAFSYTGNEWQNFFSLGGGWLMSEEEFMKDIKWLDMLKIKASYGTLGNQNLDKAYPAEPLLTNAYSAVFGKPSIIYPGYQLAYLPNPNLRWEKVEAWEAGFETNLLRNRLHFEGVYYMKNTKDLLAEVPGISGTMPGIGNLGRIQNKGVEMAITWRDQIGEWGYSVSANLTTIKNKVKSLVQDGYSIIAGDKQQSYTMAGYPIGYFYGYKVAGVYQSQADIDASPKNTLATVTPGDLKFADVNGDGEITPEDRTMIGNPTPKVTYGFSLGVDYKNWSLGIDMMGQGGNKIFRTWDNYNFAQFNYLEQRLDRWHGEGTSNTQPLLNTKHSINNLNSDYYIENGSFFRIRNIELGYTFNPGLLKKIYLKSLRLYANVQNLKTWSKCSGYTPEIGGSATSFGVDNGTYPMPTVYTFGLNLTF